MWRINIITTNPGYEEKVWHCSKEVGAVGMTPSNAQWIPLNQLCPTQMAYWAKNYVTILTRAAHLMANFDLKKTNLAKTNVLNAYES